jgi:hypothetical protein
MFKRAGEPLAGADSGAVGSDIKRRRVEKI